MIEIYLLSIILLVLAPIMILLEVIIPIFVTYISFYILKKTIYYIIFFVKHIIKIIYSILIRIKCYLRKINVFLNSARKLIIIILKKIQTEIPKMRYEILYSLAICIMLLTVICLTDSKMLSYNVFVLKYVSGYLITLVTITLLIFQLPTNNRLGIAPSFFI